MIDLLTNCTDTASRIYLLYAIASLGKNAEPANPAILSCATGERGMLDSTAKSVLKQLSSKSEAFADALDAMHKSPPRTLPPSEIDYEFGPPYPPLHFLAAALTNSPPAIRLAATNALRKIAPYLLTNASR